MARQVLPWVGAAVGFWIGGPAGAQAGFAIGGLVGNAIDPQVINGPKLGEGQDNNASEGGYRPIVLGKGAVGVCMIHEGPLKKRTIRHKQSKGGGPVTTEERAYRTMAFALGESAYPTTGVRLTRLWIDNKLRYDVTPTSQIVHESAEFANDFTFYPGDNNQQPDPDLEAFMGAGNVPSYRGGAPYIVFPDWDVTDSRGMAPMIKAEMVSDFSEVEVTGAIALGRRTIPTETNGSSFSSRGIEWGEFSNAYPGADSHGTAIGDRFVVWNIHSAYWTGDGGITWNGPFGSFGGGGYKQCYTRIGRAAIPSVSSSVVNVTTDGEHFSPVETGATGPVTCIAINSTASVAYFIDGVSGNAWAMRGTEFAQGWSVAGEIPIYAHNDHYLACSDSTFAIGGQSSNVSPSPRVAYSNNNGMTWFGATLSGSSGSQVKFLDTDNHGTWVAAIDNGELWYSTDDCETWSKSINSLEVTPEGLGFNGERFIVGGGALGNAVIMTAEAGTPGVWQQRIQPLTHINLLIVKAPRPAQVIGEKVPVSGVISWIHERVGMIPGKVYASGISDLTEGVVFSDGYNAADAIRTQMALYFFDAGEFDAGSGYRINYVKRGAPASVTLGEDDIVDGPEDWEREDSYERPRALHVAYQNPVADYGAPNITIKRTSPDVLVVGERSASIPNVFSDVDEITQRADIMMTVIYSEIAGTYDITLPISWLALAPTDCIGFSIRGRTRRLRLTNWRFSPDGTIKTEWMADRQSAYTSNVTGLPVVPPTPPPPSIVGPTVSAVLDIPALVDALDSLHVVLAASGQTEAWYGSIHQRKLPSDADFATMAQFSAPTTIMGLLEVAVSAASPHYTDTTNVVRVKLYSDDDLDTYTQEQFLSENGAFALAWDDGGVRRWEVCQYRDAVKVGDMEWEMATLLRGRLNTEAEAHPIGSLFVLLDSGIRVAPAQSSWIGQDITHRAVSNGQLPDNAVPYVESYTGESQREWPVAHVMLYLAGDDLSVEIVPRHRFGTDDHPVRSLNWDGYQIEATDGVNSATMTSASDTATIDVTGWSGTITVTVAQLNRITGAGPTVSETIEA